MSVPSKVLLTVLMLLITVACFSQTAEVVHFMRNNPATIYTSPADSIPCDAYVALPILSDLQVGVYNPTFRYGKLFKTENGYPTVFTSKEFLNSLSKKNNWLTANFDTEILGFGFRLIDKLFLSFDYRLKFNAAVSASEDFFGLLLLGNTSYMGNDHPADINLQAQISAYQELSVGVQYRFNEHWTLGARQKILLGLMNVNTQTCSAQLYTAPNDYELWLKYQARVNMSSVIPYFLNMNRGSKHFGINMDEFAIRELGQNLGLAWDLGAQYRINDRFAFTFSVLDLGFISWKSNTKQLHGSVEDNGSYYHDGGFVFGGLTENELENFISDESIRQNLVDTLLCYFPLEVESRSGYIAGLPTRMFLQFDYTLNKHHRFSAMVQAQRAGNTLIPSLSVAYSGSFSRWVDVCVAYTLMKNSYDNLGIGLGFNLKVISIYASCENIIPAINRTRLSNPNVRLGILFNWNYRK